MREFIACSAVGDNRCCVRALDVSYDIRIVIDTNVLGLNFIFTLKLVTQIYLRRLVAALFLTVCSNCFSVGIIGNNISNSGVVLECLAIIRRHIISILVGTQHDGPCSGGRSAVNLKLLNTHGHVA